jgi:hypothetical protein
LDLKFSSGLGLGLGRAGLGLGLGLVVCGLDYNTATKISTPTEPTEVSTPTVPTNISTLTEPTKISTPIEPTVQCIMRVFIIFALNLYLCIYFKCLIYFI